MKRLSLIFLVITFLFLNLFSFNVGAAAESNLTDKTQIVEIELLGDGYYCETSITVDSMAVNNSSTNSVSTITTSKTKKYKNSSGTILWYVKVTGTFAYNGRTSTCTRCSKTAKSNNSYWTIKSSSVSKSGNSATAKATATHTTANGSTDYTRSVTIKCSANGTVS